MNLSHLLLIALTVAVAQGLLCPSGWSQYGDECLKLANVATTWPSAKLACIGWDAKLISIHDTIRNAYMRSFADGLGDIWIGLVRDTCKNWWDSYCFEWADNSPYDYSRFNSGEPNGEITYNNCVQMLTNAYWDDCDCYTTRKFICTKPICPDGWTRHEDVCMKISLVSLPWSGAVEACEAMGASLVSVHTLEQNNKLASMTSEHIWIGLSKACTDGDKPPCFSWIDGRTHVFDNWYPCEPNGGVAAELCILMYADGTWNDAPCSNVKKFACEKPA